MIRKIIIVISIIFTIINGLPNSRKWGIGGIFYWKLNLIVVKEMAKNWSLVGDFSKSTDSDLGWADVNLGIRIYPLSNLPIMPNLNILAGFTFFDFDFPPKIYKSSSFTIRAGVDYFVSKHFSIGISTRPLWMQYSWAGLEEKQLDIVINDFYETGVALMFYF